MPSTNQLTIRPIMSEEAHGLARTLRAAYPSGATGSLDAYASRLVENIDGDPSIEWIGAYDGEDLVGAIRVHAFSMSCFGAMVPCGGLGGVAVALAHKKRGVARQLIEWFVQHCAARCDVVLALYPFRIDFYRSMGWGYGTPLHRYRVAPQHFAESRVDRLRNLTESDAGAIEAFLERYVAANHGMFRASSQRIQAIAKASNASEGYHSFGFFEDGLLTGCVTITSKSTQPDNRYKHDLHVVHMRHGTPRAMRAIHGFFRSQADQVDRIDVASFDPHFHHHLADPENDAEHSFHGHLEVAKRGLGIMWRLTDVASFLASIPDHRFCGEDLTLGITLPPTLGRAETERITIAFRSGHATVTSELPTVELETSLADFSSLILGVVPLQTLLDAGQTQVEPSERAADVAMLFMTPHPPTCDTEF